MAYASTIAITPSSPCYRHSTIEYPASSLHSPSLNPTIISTLNDNVTRLSGRVRPVITTAVNRTTSPAPSSHCTLPRVEQLHAPRCRRYGWCCDGRDRDRVRVLVSPTKSIYHVSTNNDYSSRISQCPTYVISIPRTPRSPSELPHVGSGCSSSSSSWAAIYPYGRPHLETPIDSVCHSSPIHSGAYFQFAPTIRDPTYLIL